VASVEGLALDDVLTNQLALRRIGEDLRRRARVAVIELVRPDVDEPVGPDRDRLRLPRRSDAREDPDVERVARLRRDRNEGSQAGQREKSSNRMPCPSASDGL
jgi:hypothetical protein